MQRVLKIVDAVNTVVKYAVALMMGLMALLVIIQVLNRSFLNFPLHWLEEVTRYLMIYVVFLGSSLAVRQKKMIAIEVLPQQLPERWRKVLLIGVLLLSIVFYVLMVRLGIQILGRVQAQVSAGTGMSMAIPYAAIPIGGVLLVLNAFAAIVDEWTTRGKEDEPCLPY
jgi:TRAP-type C4-dicarboxylate transport system permease small subunit